MTPEEWRRIEELYQAARECTAEERETLLARAEPALRAKVEAMLAHKDSGEILDRPAADLLDESSAIAQPGSSDRRESVPAAARDRAMIGRTVSRYRILDKIGEGGMGVVYKAEDTRLDRTVALKFLSSHLLDSDEARERFTHEAKAAATLDHPNICIVHEIDEADGETFLAMAYIDGPTLKEKIDERPLKLTQALDYAIEIAGGLAAAHERGIHHRDIKPANVMLGSDGHVKIMDFGLAHLAGRTRITKTGMVLGTPSYMAPEQFRGEETDRRTDIWAFGVVLHEMITGQPPFEGETEQALSYAVLHAEPEPLTALRSGVPVDLDRIVAKLLAKDPDERYQHIDEALVDLRRLRKQLPETTRTRTTAMPAAAAAKQSRLWPALAIVFLIVAAVTNILWLRQSAPELQAVLFTMEPPPGTTFSNRGGGFAASPDGRYVVFTARGDGEATASLWLRPLDSPTARRLAGTEGGYFPTWSPDSRSLAFLADGRLKRIDLNGGAPFSLGEATNDAVSATGTWNRNGVILFGSASGLRRVSASGGGATPLTEVDPAQHETGHGFPQFLPDGDRFLFFVASDDPDVQGVYASSLSDPRQRRLIVQTGAKAVYAPPRASHPGYLLWWQDETLVARRFDPDTLEFEGDPATVAEGIGLHPPAPVRARFWASDAGLLVYFAGNFGGPLQTMTWYGSEGQPLGVVGPENSYWGIRLSPDGSRAAVAVGEAEGNRDIGLFDLGREVMTRLTFDAGDDDYPTWSPDGSQIAFSSDRSDVYQIYRKDASGTGEAEQLTEGPNPKWVTDWSRDGRYLLYTERTSGTRANDIWALPLGEGQEPVPVLQTAYSEQSGQLAPNGKWIAYTSNESGQVEVYVQAFPSSGGKWQVSNQGGTLPIWSRDGTQLYYLADTFIMAAGIRTSGASIESDTPREVVPVGALNRRGSFPYDVASGGQRFIVLEPVGGDDQTPLTVVSNWQARLRR